MMRRWRGRGLAMRPKQGCTRCWRPAREPNGLCTECAMEALRLTLRIALVLRKKVAIAAPR